MGQGIALRSDIKRSPNNSPSDLNGFGLRLTVATGTTSSAHDRKRRDRRHEHAHARRHEHQSCSSGTSRVALFTSGCPLDANSTCRQRHGSSPWLPYRPWDEACPWNNPFPSLDTAWSLRNRPRRPQRLSPVKHTLTKSALINLLAAENENSAEDRRRGLCNPGKTVPWFCASASSRCRVC
jgi:hypothetical protein